MYNQLYQAFVGDEEQTFKHLESITEKLNHILFKKSFKRIRNFRPKAKKGMIIHATGLGKLIFLHLMRKTIIKTLFIVHLNDVLIQTRKSFEEVWPESSKGIYNGDETEDIINKKVVFASIKLYQEK